MAQTSLGRSHLPHRHNGAHHRSRSPFTHKIQTSISIRSFFSHSHRSAQSSSPPKAQQKSQPEMPQGNRSTLYAHPARVKDPFYVARAISYPPMLLKAPDIFLARSASKDKVLSDVVCVMEKREVYIRLGRGFRMGDLKEKGGRDWKMKRKAPQ